MITNYYRILTKEVFERIPVDGIVGGRNFRHKWSKNGLFVMVEREQGFNVNERWLTNEQALEVISTSDWTLTKDEFMQLYDM